MIMFRRHEFGPRLVNTDIRNLLTDTEAIENRQNMRDKGFADMKAGMLCLVDEDDPPAALRKKRRGCRPGRATPDDGDIVFIVTSDGEPRNSEQLRDRHRAETSAFQRYCSRDLFPTDRRFGDYRLPHSRRGAPDAASRRDSRFRRQNR